MAQRRPRVRAGSTDELLRLAAGRVQLPAGPLWPEYEDDVDLLVIKLKEGARSTHSDSDLENGIIYDYEGDELVAIEILDLYGVFVGPDAP
jgi:hypothetical protein